MCPRDSGGVELLEFCALKIAKGTLYQFFANVLMHGLIVPTCDSGGIAFHLWAFYYKYLIPPASCIELHSCNRLRFRHLGVCILFIHLTVQQFNNLTV